MAARMTPNGRLIAFWVKVDMSAGLFGCWPWLAARNQKGYGHLDRSWMGSGSAHRVAYELIVGPIPRELELDHPLPQSRVRQPLSPRTGYPPRELRGTSPAAAHAAATLCPKGHPLSGLNLYATGPRRCRTCTRERNRRYEQRRAA